MDLQSLTSAFNQYGVPGLFLLAYISNAIPGFPAVYLVLLGSYALITGDTMEAATMILVAGVGAGLGKLTVFLSSRALGHASKSAQRLREQTEWLGEEAERGIFILVLLFAWLPLPDDILYIPLGLTGFRVLAFSIAVIIGKIMLTATVYLLARAYRSFADSLLAAQTQENTGLLVGGMLAASVAASIIIFKMDWRKIYLKYKDEGPLAATITFTFELVRVLTFNTVNAEKTPSRK